MADQLIEEARAILAPATPSGEVAKQLDEVGHPDTIVEHLRAAQEHLTRACAGLRGLHERHVVPAGISGTDSVKASQLVEEVDRLAESVANYYEDAR